MFGVLLVVFLVVRLRRIKFHCRQDFGNDRFVELARVRKLLFRSRRNLFLVIVAVKNGGAITRSDISKLYIRLSRIAWSQVTLEQLVIGALRHTVLNLDRLAVAGFFG